MAFLGLGGVTRVAPRPARRAAPVAGASDGSA
jgi:hypothetical protein